MTFESYKLGSEEVRRRWRDVLDEVQNGETFLVLRNGKRVAAIIPYGHWEHVKEELENLDDNLDFAKKLQAYRDGVAAGTTEREAGYDRLIFTDIAAGHLQPMPHETPAYFADLWPERVKEQNA